MTNYQKTKIYKIESHLGDKIYVGSTAKEYLSQRFQQHKNGYKQWKAGKYRKVNSYELFDEYGVENCKIVLLESYPCNSKDEKNAREGHYIREIVCVNKYVMGRSRTEFFNENKEEILRANKDRYTANKEAILKAKKDYDQTDEAKEIRRKYIEQNKEAISQQKKEHYKNNREATTTRRREIYQRNKAEKLEQQRQSEPTTI